MATSSNYAAFMFFIAVGKALKTLQGDGSAKSKDNAIDSMILSKELTHNSHRGGPANNSKTKETRAVLREITKVANNSRAKTKAGKEGWSIPEYLAAKVPASLIRDLKKAAKMELNNLDLDDPQVAAEMKKMRGKPIVASVDKSHGKGVSKQDQLRNMRAFQFIVEIDKYLRIIRREGKSLEKKARALDKMESILDLRQGMYGSEANNPLVAKSTAVLKRILDATRMKPYDNFDGSKLKEEDLTELRDALKEDLKNIDMWALDVQEYRKNYAKDPIVASTCDKDQDKQAILAYIGEYVVKHGRSGLNQLLTSSLSGQG